MRSTIQQVKQALEGNEALEQRTRQCGTIGSITKFSYSLSCYPDLGVGTVAELAGVFKLNVYCSLSKSIATKLDEK